MASSFVMLNVLWGAQPLLGAAVAVSLWRKKLHKTFPYFMAYLLSQVVTVSVLFPVYNFASDHFYHRYWYVLNWVASVIGLTLGFNVLHEIFSDVFRPYHALRDLGTVLFRWGALVMVLVGVVVAASATSDTLPVMEQAVVAVQRCVRLAQMGLVLFLLSFASHLGIRWQHRSFGWAVGFGFFATAELLLYAVLQNGRGYLSPGAASLANMMAYDLSVMIWLAYCWINVPATVLESTRLKTHRWDRSLGEIQNPEPAESLIPMFEDMVERALARSAPATSQTSTPMAKPTSVGS
jgi:hypothetical protein